MQICERGKCTGCFACRNACPADAINVSFDKYGTTLPEIKAEKCINCGLCEKICPVNNAPTYSLAKKAFAVKSKVEEDTLSSSGGAAAVMSRYVIEDGGVVYGSAVKQRKTQHIRVDNLKDLTLLRGSKYVQSDINLSYRAAKADLENGTKVLFIGTPCQIAGFKAYLRKNYENLITVDLICHGTPPQKQLLEHLGGKCKKYDSYSFRGEHDYYLTAYSNNKVVYKNKNTCDEFFTAFSKNLICRENCYTCPYAKTERVSDITVGDFWGLDKKSLKQKMRGKVSLVLPNTEKGEEFFEAAKEGFVFEEREVAEAANKEQGQLLYPTVPHKQREEFLQNYLKYGFKKAVMKTDLGKEISKNRRKQAVFYRGLARIKRIILKH